MKLHPRIAVTIAALALAAVPALAVATQPANPGNGNGHGPTYTPAPENPGHETPPPGAGLPEKAKAYGVYCQGESKKHVAGQKGTPFSQCVTAMAKAANNAQLSPGRACKGMSHKRVKGEKGTPFSRCVKAAAKLRKAQQS
jgi:hypothetical protein